MLRTSDNKSSERLPFLELYWKIETRNRKYTVKFRLGLIAAGAILLLLITRLRVDELFSQLRRFLH